MWSFCGITERTILLSTMECLPTIPTDAGKVELRLRSVRSLTSSIEQSSVELGLSAQECFELSRTVEQEVYSMATISKMDYGQKIMQLSWNLRVNGVFLLAKYAPETLVRIDNTLLAETTEVETWVKEHTDKQNREKVLLNDEAKFDETEQLSNKGLTCNRCHSRLIAINQQQIRSADEGMTVFCTCKKCGMRWKM